MMLRTVSPASGGTSLLGASGRSTDFDGASGPVDSRASVWAIRIVRLNAVADEVSGLQRNRYAADHVPLDEGL